MTESKVATASLIIFILIVVLAFTIYVLYNTYGFSVQTEHEKQLLRTGVSAPARIIDIAPGGGRTKGGNIESRYRLEVQPEGMAAYNVEVTTFVLIRKKHLLVPGASITVKYDPQNPTDVVIVQ